MSAQTNQDDERLEKIRTLLAKAEATHFPAEAQAFSAKAHELMAKYALDEAMLDDRQGRAQEVAQKDFYLVANAYLGPKITLLSMVAYANNCRVISGWRSKRLIGGELKPTRRAVLIGLSSDCAFAEQLYTSLSLQAQEAFYNSSPQPGVNWRNAFMQAYANEIGRRLDEASERVKAQAQSQYPAQSMALVLANKKELVDRRFEELFPHTTTRRASKAGDNADTEAWSSGKEAAQQADLGKPKLGGRKQLKNKSE